MIFPAILITGGLGGHQSVELFLPSSSSASCLLPELPDQRDVHSQEGGLLCGGDLARSTCLALDTATGQWQPAANLLEERYDLVSWPRVPRHVHHLTYIGTTTCPGPRRLGWC